MTRRRAGRRGGRPVRGFAATDRSAIELLPDANRRNHFLTEVNWQHRGLSQEGEDADGGNRSAVQRDGARRERTAGEHHAPLASVITTSKRRRDRARQRQSEAVPRGQRRVRADARRGHVDGVTLTILSAFRSAATQERIKAGNGTRRPWRRVSRRTPTDWRSIWR